MEFALTAEQDMLVDMVGRWLTDNYGFERRRALISDASERRANWQQFAGLGLLAAGLPEEAGGIGGGPANTALIATELGRAAVLESYAECLIQPAALLGGIADPDRRRDMQEALGTGALCCCAALGDSVAARPELRAVKDALILDGRLRLVLGADLAETVLVPVRLTSGGGDDATAVVAVRLDSPGVRVRRYPCIDGREAADIEFTEVAIEADDVLLRGEAAVSALAEAEDRAVVAQAWEAVGIMERLVEMTVGYLKERRQFGRPLAEFQVQQHRMADLFVRTRFARAIACQGLAALDLDDDGRRRGVSATKVYVDAAAREVGGEAIHAHGGIGVTEEYPAGHYFRRLMVIARSHGESDRHLARFEQGAGG